MDWVLCSIKQPLLFGRKVVSQYWMMHFSETLISWNQRECDYYFESDEDGTKECANVQHVLSSEELMEDVPFFHSPSPYEFPTSNGCTSGKMTRSLIYHISSFLVLLWLLGSSQETLKMKIICNHLTAGVVLCHLSSNQFIKYNHSLIHLSIWGTFCWQSLPYARLLPNWNF